MRSGAQRPRSPTPTGPSSTRRRGLPLGLPHRHHPGDRGDRGDGHDRHDRGNRHGGRHPVVWGSVLCALGLTGVVVGVGIGLPHLARAGASVTSLLGLVALGGGLGLLVLGARTLLRGRRWWVAAVSVAALGAVTGIALLTVGQALAATVVAPSRLADAIPTDLGPAARGVTASTADGVALSGWYLPSTNGAAVVLRHGAGSTRTDVLAQAAVLGRGGYGVLMLDARGHGASGGRAMDLGWFGDEDVRAGVDLLVAQPEVDPDRIGVVGLSMGGEEAIGAAATDPRIRAVVAEGAEQRVAADKAWMADAYGLAGRVQGVLDRLTYGAVDLLTGADPPIALRDAVGRAAPRPVLLIAGGAVADEQRAAQWIRAASPSTVTVWVVPSAGHVQGLAVEPEQWADRVLGFLDENLAARE